MPFFRQALPDEWLKTLKKLQKLDVDKLVPGHGEVSPKSYLPEMSKTVKMWIDTVAAAIEKGMNKQEVLEKVTMAEHYPEAAGDQRMSGIIRMNVERLYEYLKK
jgi:glyoxylase-like metal-dependent hydrolase (beta-lactamase superfamily II)